MASSAKITRRQRAEVRNFLCRAWKKSVNVLRVFVSAICGDGITMRTQTLKQQTMRQKRWQPYFLLALQGRSNSPTNIFLEADL